MLKTEIPRVVSGRDLIRDLNEAFDECIMLRNMDPDLDYYYAGPSCGLPVELIESKSRFLSNFTIFWITGTNTVQSEWFHTGNVRLLCTEHHLVAENAMTTDWQILATSGRLPVIYEPEILELDNILSRLGVPHMVDRKVFPFLSKAGMEAVSIVVDILADRIHSGAPVAEVRVEPLIDVDAGQWTEVVFTIQVNLNTAEANKEWDRVLENISEARRNIAKPEVATFLGENIGTHFTWVTDRDV
jgi:hypothetical protein